MHHTSFARGRPGALAPAAVLLLALCLLAGGVQALTDSPALVVSEPGLYTLDHDLAPDATVGVLINGSDVVFDGMGHSITGTDANGSIGVLVTGRYTAAEGEMIANVTIRNVTVSGWGSGVRLAEVSGTVVEDVTAEQNGVGLSISPTTGITGDHMVRDSVFRENTGRGLDLSYPSEGITVERCAVTGNGIGISAFDIAHGSTNTLADCDISENTGDGLNSRDGSFAVVRNCTVSANGDDGLEFEHGGAEIVGCHIERNAAAGVDVSDRGGSDIHGNWIEGNAIGVSDGGDWPSHVRNNVLNNTDNGFFRSNGDIGTLNYTKSAGPNIIGGPYLGGNYWAFPNGTGFSQTHPDTNGDGFCDEPYPVTEDAVDYLPLALMTVPPVGGDRGYFLVSTVPSGAAISLVDISGTSYPQGNTSAGPLNVTIYLTATPMKQIVADLSGYRDAVYTITQYPAKGQTVPVSLTLEPIGPAPFKPLSVPGRIQAEDYNLGGEGVAYHDTTPGNSGGAYRHDDVDIEQTAGLATPNVGWIRNGEYLTYTVNVTQDGNYAVTARMASPNNGRMVTLSVDGVPKTTITVPNTGSFDTYRDVGLTESFITATITPSGTGGGLVQTPIQLSAGTHTLELSFSGDGQNIDWFELTSIAEPTPTPTPVSPEPYKPLAIPGTIQAEDYNLGGEGVAYHDTTPGNSGGAYRHDDVDIETAGGITNVGWIRNGEYLTYTANITTAGAYTMTARVASPNSGRTMALSVDGSSIATISIPNTGSFATFRTVEIPVTLAAGAHTLKLTFAGDGQNLDWIAFGAPTTPTVTVTSTPTAGGASFTAAPLTAPRGSAVKFTLIPASGKSIGSAWWSFDAPAHLNTWNSRSTNPTFFYPSAGTFSPLVKITYTDGSSETVQRTGYIRAT